MILLGEIVVSCWLICCGDLHWIPYVNIFLLFQWDILSITSLFHLATSKPENLEHRFGLGWFGLPAHMSAELWYRPAYMLRSDNLRSLALMDILSWQTSSLHLSTSRMTYRSSTSSTFVLNTGFITLDISKEKYRWNNQKIKKTWWDHLPGISDYLLPIFGKLFYWGYVGQN